MRRPAFAIVLVIVWLPLLAPPTLAQGRAAGPPGVSAESLRVKLFALADDSMAGRDTGSPGNVKAVEWVAAAFQRYGLQPAGENGGWFQTIPFWRIGPDTSSRISAGATSLIVGRDIVPIGGSDWRADGRTAIYGGVIGDTATYASAERTAGRLVVFAVRPGADLRAAMGLVPATRRNPRFAGNVGIAVAVLEAVGSDLVDQIMHGRITTDTTPPPVLPPTLLVSRGAAATLVGMDLATAQPGQSGPELGGGIAVVREPLRYPSRNVVGILPGSDPALRGTYVALSAHNDHVGLARRPVDHDSARAFNRVVRPAGADSRMRDPTPAEATRIAQIRDSLRAAHAPRQDSVFNGADDDGSGTVALLELARVLAAGPRPRRSILFVSHAAEEVGLRGSAWYTDHATVPVDSIVGEIDMDMIGRGGADDLPHGGPGYIEVVGSKRLSNEFGTLLESVNARLPQPFTFNYEFDAPGHPLQYYCRADHYSYARYGIPSVSISAGGHLDYHQVTDEPQYIDYDKLARIATLAQRTSVAVANLDHRPAVDGPRGDPHAPCRQ